LQAVGIQSSTRYEIFIALAPPFGGEKVIVSAATAVRIASADRRTRVIDRASAGIGIKKLANVFEDVIFMVAKYSAERRVFCVALFCLLEGDAEVSRDPQ